MQAANTKKENDQLKKDNKKQQLDQQQLELRLTRALEEIEKQKMQVQKSHSATKDAGEQERRRLDQLQADNKRLQKQKLELIQAFKKQLKLIDILKKQKMHLEAARILQFSEEEFINALEWNSTSSNGNEVAPLATQTAAQQASTASKLGVSSRINSNRPPSGRDVGVAANRISNQMQKQKPFQLLVHHKQNRMASSRSLGSDINNIGQKEMTDAREQNNENDNGENDDFMQDKEIEDDDYLDEIPGNNKDEPTEDFDENDQPNDHKFNNHYRNLADFNGTPSELNDYDDDDNFDN